MNNVNSALVLVAASLWAGLALAQSTFVQIEAHQSLGVAQDRARDFSAQTVDVNGFRMGAGWYVISLGPYNESGAVARMQTLRSQGTIPQDSFLVDGSAYAQQFWPVGANALTAPAIVIPQTNAQTATLEQPVAPIVEPEVPDENRREAIRSESRLTRQEKFDIQIALQWFGFYDGAIDASYGPGTRNSMAAWQTSKIILV